MKKFCATLLLALVFASAFAHSPRLSFDFRENLGQWPSQVLYKASMGGSTVFLEQNTMTWVLAHPEDFALVHESSEWSQADLDAWQFRGHAYKVNFVGGSTDNVVGQDEQSYYYNYFIGNNPDKWASYVHAFSAVRYANIWDGIGLRVYNSASQFKYDFIVNVGADANLVQLSYDGIDGMELADGNLLLHTSVGDVIEQMPFAYQMNGNQIEEVVCQYVLENGKMSFAFPNGYDLTRQLIIDPLVIASTLSGTVGDDNYGHSAAYDIAGNIYTGARSFGPGYPTTTGAFQESFSSGGGWGVDMAFSKLNPEGTDLIWASYLGGSASEYPHSMIINEFEELYTYGSTESDDFPTTDGAYDESFNGDVDIAVTHFASDGGSLIGSTLIGGADRDGRNSVTNNYGDQFRGEIILDFDGNPAIASFSESTDFPTTGGAYQPTALSGTDDQDAVLIKLNPNLTSLTWSTYFGGTSGEAGFGLRFAVDGTVYLVGGTQSNDLPVSTGAYQATNTGGNSGYLAHFSADVNDLLECTYYGGSQNNNIFFIDLDNDENVWVYGQSLDELPITDGVYSEDNGSIFVTKFNQTLSELLAGTMVVASAWGGTGAVPVAFLVDRCDNIYISGYSAGTGLTTTDDAVYTTGGFYLAAYGPELETLEFATYYGANHVDGGTSRFDKNGIVYQGVCSGGGFPTNVDAWAPDQATGWDIGVFKMDFQVSGVNAQLTASAEALNGCAPHNVDFNNYSVGDMFQWDFGDGSPINTEFEPSHEFTDPGVYTIQLISSDSLSCNLADTAYLEISVSEPIDFNAAFNLTLDCEDLSVSTQNLTGIEWLDYEWDMGDGTILSGENVEHVYGEEGEFTVTLNAVDNGCVADDAAEQTVQIVGSVEASSLIDDYEGCGELEINFENTSNGITYEWDFGDGSPITTEENPTHTFGPGQYTVLLTAYHPESCNLVDDTTLLVTVGEEQIIGAGFQLLQTDCENLLVEGTNQSIGDNLAFLWDMGDGTTYTTEDITHNYASVGMYDIELLITDTLCDATDAQLLSVNVLEEVAAIIGNPNLEGCDPFIAEFTNNSAGTNFYWDFGDGSPIEEAQIASHQYAAPGTYDVTLIVEGVGNCGGMDTTYATVNVIETPLIDALFTMEQQGACEAMSVNFDDLSTGPNLSYDWDVAGVEYSVAEFDHVFNGAGVYTVTLTITEPTCDVSDTFSDQIFVLDGIDLEAPADVYMCFYDTSVELVVNGPVEAEYLWDTEDVGTSTVVTEPGIYTLTATLNNCLDAIGVEVVPVEELELLDTPRACEGLQTLLEIPYDQGTNYQWCTGEPADFIYASEAGEYCYQFTDEFGCTQEGMVILEHIARDAEVYIPNAFTPNNDGVNDVFQPVAADVRDYKLTVWNRWGDKVFETESTEAFWDGSFNGSEHYVQNEEYTYQVEYNGTCNAEKILVTGNVLLLR